VIELSNGSEAAKIEGLFDPDVVKGSLQEIEVDHQPETESTPILERQMQVITLTVLSPLLERGILNSSFGQRTFD
jgi:hypothetical protein